MKGIAAYLNRPTPEQYLGGFALALLSGILYLPLLLTLSTIVHEDSYSFIPLVAIISVVLIVRKSIIDPLPKRALDMRSLWYGGPAAILYISGMAAHRHGVLGAALLALSCICFLTAAGAVLWGRQWVRHHRFPLLFLLFAVPLPPFILTGISVYLQYGSAEFVDVFLRVSGLTFLRDGLVFHLPVMPIFIAEECSGIRSTIALLVATVLAAQISLRSPWRKLLVVLSIFPISLIKNALRITALSVLATKVDVGYLTNSYLHHEGGYIFFGISLGILFLFVGILRLTESSKRPKKSDTVQQRSGESGTTPSVSAS